MSQKIITILDELRTSMAAFDFSDIGSKRLAILNVFMRLAAARGYAAVTMRAIGAELKIKAPSIYSHFPGGREEITEYCLRWQSRDYGESLLKAVEGVRSHDEMWDALVRNHCRQMLENPNNRLWDMIVASDRVGRFLPANLRADMNERVELFIRLYEAVGEALGHEDSRQKARAVLSLMDSAEIWCDWPSDKSLRNVALDKAVAISRGILASQFDLEKVSRTVKASA
ncbi:TetR/AcrR family transcriptional regulator [Agrobacterium sp. SOY23]|uniref:TetR/AcrR family transcriptional regulator n=1 Tax=Agrobacterium sp. SOY23 TaxID=3014555 RepID=UPI0022B065E2|nr:TetR/AcrR family transcriptional regulator [Agrobacterium sp. SOY23]MCZ4433022.1 TetR/AcrR family transcriptional regulator [Agrobacterium sp. SOY23]